MASTPSFVGIVCTHQKVLGTGFVVDPKGELVVTAAHIVSGAIGANDKLFFRLFGNPRLHEIAPLVTHTSADISLFEAPHSIPIDLGSLKLVTEVRPSDNVWIVGYTEEGELRREYKSAQGKFRGPTMKDGVEIFEVDMQAVYKGMSGAPVMVRGGGVIGVQTHRVNEHGVAGALVVPIDYVAALDGRIQTERTKYLHWLIQSLRTQQRKLFDFAECYPISVKSDAIDASPKSAYDLIDKEDKFVLVGPAGSGKSTILRELAIRVAASALKDPKHSLPVFVELHQWKNSPASFEAFLQEKLEQESLLQSRDHRSLREMLAKRRFHLFLDTIDELDSAKIRLLSDWVDEVDAKLVLTSRDYRFLGLDRFPSLVAHLEPLNARTVFEFAKSFLGDTHLADSFVTSLGIAKSSHDPWSVSISELAGNPFFLSAALDSHRRDQLWQLKPRYGQELTQWSVFEGIFQQLWHAPRVVELLNKNWDLREEYYDPNAIISVLSLVVSKNPGITALERDVVEEWLGSDLLEVLYQSTILTRDPSDGTYKFPHLLFVDFLRASSVDLNRIGDYIQRYEYRQALTLLATRGERERKIIQAALLGALEKKPLVTSAFGRDWMVGALGDIGDEHAVDLLINIQSQSETRDYDPSSHDRSIAVAKIANRLSDQNPYKYKVIQFLRSRTTVVHSWPVDINGDILYQLGFPYGPMGDYLEAAEALSYIRSPEALDAILEVLDLSARYLYDKPSSGGWLRERWFAQYISNLGGWTVPRLLEAIYSDHPAVSTTIARAVLMLNRAADVAPLGKILVSHPHETVRAYVAAALGEQRFPEAVPYLCSAINDDGYWAIGGGLFGPPSFRFVADHVAGALAEFGTPECKTALLKNQYDEHGEWTDQLLVGRLEDIRLDSTTQQPWVKLQIAGNLAARDRIDTLLPRLGHVERQTAPGFSIMCPIASQLIRRYNLSRSDEGEAPRLKDYRDISADLIDFIETNSDPVSVTWALVVLGMVGNGNTYSFLRQFLSEGRTQAMLGGAAFGLGSYVGRNVRNLDITLTQEVCDLLIATLDRSTAEAHGGVSHGLSSVVSACLGASLNTITQYVRAILVQRIETGVGPASRAALDALEVVCVENEGFIDTTIRTFLDASPSYYSKLGDSDYAENQRKKTTPNLARWVDYDNTLQLYERALEAKLDPEAWWRSQYTEDDWRDLGCCDGYLYHHIGKLMIVKENWSAAIEALYKSCSAIAGYDKPSDAENSIYLHSMLEIGNIAARFLKVPEVAGHYHSAALEFAMNQERQNWTKELAQLFLHSMSNHQETIRLFDRHDQVIAVGLVSLELLAWAGTVDEEAMADIYVNIHQSASALHDLETAMNAIQNACVLLARSPRRNFRASTILARAEMMQAVDPSADVETDAAETRAYFQELGVPLMVAKADCVLAMSADHAGNPADARRWYEDALAVLETTDDSDAITQKVVVLHRLALLHQSEGNHELSSRLFEDTFIAIESSGQVPEFVVHAIRSDHAKLLHALGHHDRAVGELVALIRERAELGMGPGYPDDVLSEIDALPGCKMPASGARYLADAVINAIRGNVDARAVELHLMSVLFALDETEMHHERQFIRTLLDLLHGENVDISDSPFEPFLLPVRSVV